MSFEDPERGITIRPCPGGTAAITIEFSAQKGKRLHFAGAHHGRVIRYRKKGKTLLRMRMYEQKKIRDTDKTRTVKLGWYAYLTPLQVSELRRLIGEMQPANAEELALKERALAYIAVKN